MIKADGESSFDRQNANHTENTMLDDTGLVSLVMLAQFFEKPADPAQLAHEYAPDGLAVDEVQLLRAAKSLGFKAKTIDLPASRLDKAPLPVIGQWVDEEVEIEVEARPHPRLRHHKRGFLLVLSARSTSRRKPPSRAKNDALSLHQCGEGR